MSETLSFFISRRKRIKKVIIPDKDVAKASPQTLRGNINIVFSPIFSPKVKADTLVGVRVSFKAKKQDCKIFVAP
jgi:hypothetical protein